MDLIELSNLVSFEIAVEGRIPTSFKVKKAGLVGVKTTYETRKSRSQFNIAILLTKLILDELLKHSSTTQSLKKIVVCPDLHAFSSSENSPSLASALSSSVVGITHFKPSCCTLFLENTP